MDMHEKKNNIRRVVFFVVAAVLLLTGCSGESDVDGAEKLARFSSADDQLIIVADLSRLPLESDLNALLAARCSVAEADVNAILGSKFLEHTAALFTGAFGDSGSGCSGFAVLGVKDARKFVEALAEDRNEEVVTIADYVCLDRPGLPVAANGRMAYVGYGNGCGDSATDLIMAVENAEAAATAKPLPQWLAQRLTDEKWSMRAALNVEAASQRNAGGLAGRLKEIFGPVSHLCMAFDAGKQQANFEAEALSRSGQPVAILPGKKDASVDEKLFKYASGTDVVFAGAASMRDLEHLLPDASMLTSVAETLGVDAEGAVMVAGGPDPSDPGALMAPTAANWHWVMAMEFPEGQASRALSRIGRLLRFTGMGATMSGDSLMLELPVEGRRMYDSEVMVPVTLSVSGNALVAEGGVLAEGPATADFKPLQGKQAGVIVALPASAPALKALQTGFGVNGEVTVSENRMEGTLRLTDTDMTLIQAIEKLLGTSFN